MRVCIIGVMSGGSDSSTGVRRLLDTVVVDDDLPLSTAIPPVGVEGGEMSAENCPPRIALDEFQFWVNGVCHLVLCMFGTVWCC